jgi:mannose-1-phosphate guanylyltransferase/phosphomannomutase
VLPINLSRGYTELVERAGGSVEISRTGLGNVAIKASDVRADLASLADGRYIFPSFLPAPDCFITIARVLEAFRTDPLSEARQRFGDSFGRVARERIECPWAAKGRVMRGLAEKVRRRPRRHPHRRRSAERGRRLGPHASRPRPPCLLRLRRTDEDGTEPADIMKEYVELVKSLIDDQAMLSS